MMGMNVLVACESSATVRDAFNALGHNAWSCDLLPTEGMASNHLMGDVRYAIEGLLHKFPDAIDMRSGNKPMFIKWDLMIAHPPCTRLANSGVRWLHKPPSGKTIEAMWRELDEAAEFYKMLRDAPIPGKAIENPIMHRYAKERINPGKRQIIQPWWFGDEAFKATCLELVGLPCLIPTNKLTPPKPRTEQYKLWSKVHLMSPRKDRWKERSRTYQGIASAMAAQWSAAWAQGRIY